MKGEVRREERGRVNESESEREITRARVREDEE